MSAIDKRLKVLFKAKSQAQASAMAERYMLQFNLEDKHAVEAVLKVIEQVNAYLKKEWFVTIPNLLLKGHTVMCIIKGIQRGDYSVEGGATVLYLASTANLDKFIR